MSALTAFWSIMSGTVHPADRQVLEDHDPTASILNRDFPPPAFIGDVDNAPIVILMGNGGYDPVLTPLEFPDSEAVSRYVAYLRKPGPVEPAWISPYYAQHFAAPLIRTGQAVIVNACAYRSSRSMNANTRTRLRKITDLLPSVRQARQWVKDELMTATNEGRRLAIVHRPGMWRLPPGDRNNFHQAVNPEWNRQALPTRFRILIQDFMTRSSR